MNAMMMFWLPLLSHPIQIDGLKLADGPKLQGPFKDSGTDFDPLNGDPFDIIYHPDYSDSRALIDNYPLPDEPAQMQYVTSAPGRFDVVVTKCGQVIKDGSTRALDSANHGCRAPGGDFFQWCYDKKKRPEFDTVVSMTQIWTGAYYHFVVEVMTKFSIVHKQDQSLLSTAWFHVGIDGAHSGFAKEWAEMLGVDPGRLVGGSVKANTVVVPPSNGCGRIRPDYAVETRSILHNHLQKVAAPPPASFRKAVLVKRSHTRVLTNHESVLNLLKDFGYDVHELVEGAEGSARSQCTLFSEANLIVGPHGAAFSNLLCATAGTPFIEIQQEDHNDVFAFLATQLGLRYFGIRSHMHCDTNGEANIEAVQDALKQVG